MRTYHHPRRAPFIADLTVAALLETRLGIGTNRVPASSESLVTANQTEDTIQAIESHRKALVETSDLDLNDSGDHLSATASQSKGSSSPMSENFASQEMFCSRVQDTLPLAEVQNEL